MGSARMRVLSTMSTMPMTRSLLPSPPRAFLILSSMAFPEGFRGFLAA